MFLGTLYVRAQGKAQTPGPCAAALRSSFLTTKPNLTKQVIQQYIAEAVSLKRPCTKKISILPHVVPSTIISGRGPIDSILSPEERRTVLWSGHGLTGRA